MPLASDKINIDGIFGKRERKQARSLNFEEPFVDFL